MLKCFFLLETTLVFHFCFSCKIVEIIKIHYYFGHKKGEFMDDTGAEPLPMRDVGIASAVLYKKPRQVLFVGSRIYVCMVPVAYGTAIFQLEDGVDTTLVDWPLVECPVQACYATDYGKEAFIVLAENRMLLVDVKGGAVLDSMGIIDNCLVVNTSNMRGVPGGFAVQNMEEGFSCFVTTTAERFILPILPHKDGFFCVHSISRVWDATGVQWTGCVGIYTRDMVCVRQFPFNRPTTKVSFTVGEDLYFILTFGGCKDIAAYCLEDGVLQYRWAAPFVTDAGFLYYGNDQLHVVYVAAGVWRLRSYNVGARSRRPSRSVRGLAERSLGLAAPISSFIDSVVKDSTNNRFVFHRKNKM